MATNKIYKFAENGTTSDLLTDSEYDADSQRLIGNQPGIARAKLVNKALKQHSVMSAGLASFLATNQATNIDDTLTGPQIETAIGAALNGFAKGSNQLLAVNGYQIFAGGLIIQWGTLNDAVNTDGVITFPITFPTACLFRICRNTNDFSTTPAPDTIEVTAYDTKTVSSFKWVSTNVNTGVLTAPGTFSWFAIGY